MIIERSSVSGLKAANEALKKLSKAAQNRVLKNSVRAGGIVMRTALRDAAPDNAGDRSSASQTYGTLRQNIRITMFRKKYRDVAGCSVNTGDAFWGYYIEYGTGKFYVGAGANSKRDKARTHIKPEPWFRPTVDHGYPVAVHAIKEKLADGILKEATKLSKVRG